MKDELKVSDGIVTRLGSILIPQPLRKRALEAAHLGHPGISAMKSIIRQRAWWPGISADVEKWDKECIACNLTGTHSKPVPMRVSTLQKEAVTKAVNAHNMAEHRITGVAPEVMLFGRLRRAHLPVAGNSSMHVWRSETAPRSPNTKTEKTRKVAQRRQTLVWVTRS